MPPFKLLVLLFCMSVFAAAQFCPDYADYAAAPHAPFSGGTYNLSYQRPVASCRTFTSSAVESTIARLNSTITDPDLSRLFENSFPNTLDTAIKWKGYAADNADEELTFVITGDINAMWLRDSANQMQSYLSLLNTTTGTSASSNDTIASLYRGVINLQSRYLLSNPYCNSFQPPSESGLSPSINSAATNDAVIPPYSNTTVYECKYELDSLAAFLEISTDYYTATNDLAFFSEYNWVSAIQAVMNTAQSMTTSTYAANGSANTLPYTFQRLTTTAEDTLDNKGTGNPVQNGTGLIRSAFRPSDDACIYEFFIPANMMFAHYLNTTSTILTAMGDTADLANETAALSASITAAITEHGIVSDPIYGSIYAYEVDGYGGRTIVDDANIPSLLSAPLIRHLNRNDTTYQATRALLLSANNPYFMRGTVINAIGGPHDGPGYAWPMASIVRILTSDDDGEIFDTLKELVVSTDGLGLVHESINTFDQSDYTRPWFSWVNGLFGQMVLDLETRKPEILRMSFQ
ncbi:MAG: hypothetical protein ASARMPREDX12_006983 [Alectoria sarmentosa]|nr:MAG: hypothetical protein ASARMPREDX12_006983 [Alectoria sarmentosa]